MHKSASGPRTIEIRSFGDYTKFLTKELDRELVLFRGQRRDLPLLPKIARIPRHAPLMEAEAEIIRTFREQAILYLPRVPSSTWEWLALAQHHGLPTRLLDWTRNPLAALWFAVARPSEQQEHGVVWVFAPDAADLLVGDDPFTPIRTVVFRPTHVAERIRVQAGYFTVHRLTAKGAVRLENNKLYKAKLTKLTIPGDCFSDLRYDLDRFGVNESTLFPDLQGLCHHIEWINTLLTDERADVPRNKG